MKVSIEFEICPSINEKKLHELLCLAIHENDHSSIKSLSNNVLDIVIAK